MTTQLRRAGRAILTALFAYSLAVSVLFICQEDPHLRQIARVAGLVPPETPCEVTSGALADSPNIDAFCSHQAPSSVSRAAVPFAALCAIIVAWTLASAGELAWSGLVMWALYRACSNGWLDADPHSFTCSVQAGNRVMFDLVCETPRRAAGDQLEGAVFVAAIAVLVATYATMMFGQGSGDTIGEIGRHHSCASESGALHAARGQA